MLHAVSGSDPHIRQLLSEGVLSDDQLQIGLTESKRSGDALEKTLQRLGFVTESLINDAVASYSESGSSPIQQIDLKAVLPDPQALKLVSAETARRYVLAPVALANGELQIAISDPYDLPAKDRLKSMVDSGISLQFLLSSERDIGEFIDRFYGFELSIDGILHEIETGEIDNDVTATAADYHQPVVRLVDAILIDAVKHAASDIHLEPEAGFVRIRYRVDGVMRQIRSFHIDYWPAIVVRIKVMADLNIAESRAPQDGQLSMTVSGGAIEFRVSCMPTVHGENIVLRLLDRQKGIVALDTFGLQPHILDELTVSMDRPEGLILITGPTGSGKTTTLYSMLAHKSDERINIMTLEDPVEYPMALLRQTTVNEQVKLDFTTGIKAILRQDPDVILVGEIRDQNVAEMVFRASMTGHQVYSTLHANSAVGAITRLKDLGISPAVIGSNTISIIGQRLVRKLCVSCRAPDKSANFDFAVYTSTGCGHCDWLGYKGRVAVIEVLRFTAELSQLIASNADAGSILQQATKNDYSTLTQEANRLVREGITSMTEVARVIDFTNI